MLLGTLRLHDSDAIDALLAAGLLLDTADVYGWRPGETQLRVAGYPAQTKVGLVRRGSTWSVKGTAKHLEAQARAAHAVLGTLPTLLLHAIDPAVPLERSWRALQRLKVEGIAVRLGLCNARHHEVLQVLALGDLDVVQIALSPHDPTALETGVVRLCLEHGIEVQAHSPLGGWRRKGRTVKAWSAICRAHDVSPARLSLRWLESLGVVPAVGCTRLATLDDARGPVPDDALQAAHEALPVGRWAHQRPQNPTGPREVVLIAGLPAAGKTTPAHSFGHPRLNRDELGGTLKGLAGRLDTLLATEPSVVSDNTWGERVARARMVRIAHAHGCRVTAHHVTTTPEQCAIQAVRRILADGEGLPTPDALKRDPRPHWFGPDALFRQQARWEPLTDDEGFELHTAPAPTLSWGSGAGTIVDLDTLESLDPRNGPVFAALWAPDAARRARVDAALERHPVLDHRICVHPPGPPVCWCRKPLPGMAVDLLLTHGLDPARTTFVGGPAERTLATRLGATFRSRTP